MISIHHKSSSLRTAKAQAVVKLSPKAFEALQTHQSPKGDVLEVARVAGTMAAKRTSEIIPYCHPIPIDHVKIDYSIENETVIILVEVTSTGKTGVEMEALLAAQITATTIFDMLKPVDSEMEITDIRVLEKKGGKSSFHDRPPPNFQVAVIVTSDGTFAGTRKDKSGKIICDYLKRYGIETIHYVILPDEKEKIKETLQQLSCDQFDLVLTTGGTGLGPRDVTVEATQEVIEQEIPGVMEAARKYGQDRNPYAMLSRGLAGRKGQTVIVNLPGSSKGTEESLCAIFPALLHAYPMMKGGGH